MKSLGDLPFAEECMGIARCSAFFGLIVTSWNALLAPGMSISMLPCDFWPVDSDADAFTLLGSQCLLPGYLSETCCLVSSSSTFAI